MDQRLSNKDGVENNIKKPYQKPIINQVHLVPDEAVLSTCKFGTESGAFAACRNEGDWSCDMIGGS